LEHGHREVGSVPKPSHGWTMADQKADDLVAVSGKEVQYGRGFGLADASSERLEVENAFARLPCKEPSLAIDVVEQVDVRRRITLLDSPYRTELPPWSS